MYVPALDPRRLALVLALGASAGALLAQPAVPQPDSAAMRMPLTANGSVPNNVTQDPVKGEVVNLPEDLAPDQAKIEFDESGPAVDLKQGAEIAPGEVAKGEYKADWFVDGQKLPGENGPNLAEPKFEKPGDFKVSNHGKREVGPPPGAEPPKDTGEIPPQTESGEDVVAGDRTLEPTSTANTRVWDMTPPTGDILITVGDTNETNEVFVKEDPVNAPVGRKTVEVAAVGPNFSEEVTRGESNPSAKDPRAFPSITDGPIPADLDPTKYPITRTDVTVDDGSGLINGRGIYLPKDVRTRYELKDIVDNDLPMAAGSGAPPWKVEVRATQGSQDFSNAVVHEPDPEGLGGSLIFRAANAADPSIQYALVYSLVDARGNSMQLTLPVIVYDRTVTVDKLDASQASE